jgi:hypothetical protein
MTGKILAAAGALLLFGGGAIFLLGAFVLTNNARHGSISPAVYWGAGMAALGLLVLGVAGLVAVVCRSPKR